MKLKHFSYLNLNYSEKFIDCKYATLFLIGYSPSIPKWL